MTELAEKIELLSTEVKNIETARERENRKRNLALAALETSRPRSVENASAVRDINEAEQVLWVLDQQGPRKAAALDMMRKQAELLDAPKFAEQSNETIKKALALRADLGKQCKVVAKKADAMVSELRKMAEIQNDLLALDSNFDASGTGRVSVISWIADRMSFYTGKDAYPYQSSKPELPGSMFTAPTAIEASIHRSMEQRAHNQVRAELAQETDYD